MTVVGFPGTKVTTFDEGSGGEIPKRLDEINWDPTLGMPHGGVGDNGVREPESPVPSYNKWAETNDLARYKEGSKVGATQKFLDRLDELSRANVEMARKKNADYANEGDPFANFNTAPMCGVSVERGMLVRMGDKMKRISNLLDRDAQVADESILDTCSDLANYALILRIWLEGRK